jgi:hypothetical protein
MLLIDLIKSKMKIPIELIAENGKLVVRVTGKNGNIAGLKMGTDFEESDIQAAFGFANEVYKIGFADANVDTIDSEEQKPTIFIGVIAKNIEDFLNWKEENKHIATQANKDTVRIYTVGNTTYVCLSKPNHCKSYSFDEFKETATAYLNADYHKILEYVKPCLKLPERFKAGVKKYGWESEFVKEYHALMAQLKFSERDQFFDKWNV